MNVSTLLIQVWSLHFGCTFLSKLVWATGCLGLYPEPQLHSCLLWAETGEWDTEFGSHVFEEAVHQAVLIFRMCDVLPHMAKGILQK